MALQANASVLLLAATSVRAERGHDWFHEQQRPALSILVSKQGFHVVFSRHVCAETV